LHGLKLRATGRQSGGRDQGAVPRRPRRVDSLGGRSLRGDSWWSADLREIEGRAPRHPWRNRTAAPDAGAV